MAALTQLVALVVLIERMCTFAFCIKQLILLLITLKLVMPTCKQEAAAKVLS